MSIRMHAPQNYEDYQVAYQFRPFARDLVMRAAVRPDERVLDIACGTGVVARLIAPFVGSTGSIIGLDLSPSMLAVARECAETEGVVVDWREGDATALPFDDASFDLALNQQGLQYIPDKPAALREMRRILAPGGRAFVATWAPLTEDHVREVVDRVAREHIGFSSLASRFGLGTAETLRALMEAAGFAEVTSTPVELMLHFPSYTEWVRATVAPDLAQLPTAEQEMTARAVEEKMRYDHRLATISTARRFAARRRRLSPRHLAKLDFPHLIGSEQTGCLQSSLEDPASTRFLGIVRFAAFAQSDVFASTPGHRYATSLGAIENR